MDAISIVGLCKSFGEKRVFDGFSASIQIGEITAVIAESGRGKTTLFEMMLGLIAPDRGSITGVPKKISAVFQEDRLIPHLSVAENAAIGGPGRVDARTVALHLEMLGLAGSADAPARTLSGGMKRRAAVARACLAPSEIIFFDEPFASLDENNIARVINYILETRRGRTIVAALHDKKYAALLGAGIIELD